MTDSIYYPLSGEHTRTAQHPLHVPRVLGFPHVLRLRPVASLCKTSPARMWFWQLDWQLSTRKWLGCQSCYAKGDKELSDNHCHWFLYLRFFQFTEYFNCEISCNCILPKWGKIVIFSHFFPCARIAFLYSFLTPPSLAIVIYKLSN